MPLLPVAPGASAKLWVSTLSRRASKYSSPAARNPSCKLTAREIGAAAYYVLDIGKVSEIPEFVKKVTSEHPELDCLVNNAGVQRPIHVLKTDDFLQKADQEIDINIRGPIQLALGFLPHLRKKPKAVIMNVSSVLGFVPFSIINPVYNETKAFMHSWCLNLRTQLKNGGSSIKVIEIIPPQVETDWHRERDDPDDNKKSKSKSSLSIEDFMEEVSRKLENGDETITAGMGNYIVKKWYDAYGEHYNRAASA